jgi:hypothetical protein
MKKLDEIKQAILLLSAEEFSRFSEWFVELCYKRWDARLEGDIAAFRRFAEETQAWRTELARRMAEINSGKVAPHERLKYLRKAFP